MATCVVRSSAKLLLEDVFFLEVGDGTTLVGCTIATVSSTVLYINVVLLLANGAFRQNNVLNPLVFMVSMDSILNCVGMLLVSGIPKAAMKVYKRRVTKTRGVLTSVTPMPYPPTPPLECENMA